MPGLLQIREYRRALLWAEFPDMTPEAVELCLDVVMQRQDLLDREDFHFEALIAESVLDTIVGGQSVLADQLSHLLAASQLPTVTLRVVGKNAKDQVGVVTAPFVLFDLPPLPTSRLRQAPVVYVEGHFGRIYVEGQSEVARYSRVVERMRRIAHSEEESRDLLLGALNHEGDDRPIADSIVQEQQQFRTA